MDKSVPENIKRKITVSNVFNTPLNPKLGLKRIRKWSEMVHDASLSLIKGKRRKQILIRNNLPRPTQNPKKEVLLKENG